MKDLESVQAIDPTRVDNRYDVFFRMGLSRTLLVYFCPFLITISIIQI